MINGIITNWEEQDHKIYENLTKTGQTIRKECNFYDISPKTKRNNMLIDGPTTKKEAEITIHREHERMSDLKSCREALYYITF